MNRGLLFVVAICFTFLNASLFANEQTVPPTSQPNMEQKVEQININTADLAALTRLPGIGKSKAQAIIQYRDAQGAFKSIEQLAEIKGLGTKSIKRIEQYVTF